MRRDCFVGRRDVLLVVRSLRCGADAMRQEGQVAPGPQNDLLRRGAEVPHKPCANFIDPYSLAAGLLPKRKATC